MNVSVEDIQNGNIKQLARTISLVENNSPGYEQLLLSLPSSTTPVIGITGPPGAGKSTLVDGLIEQIVKLDKRVGVLCVDPSSPFNYGALLGDRIRMSSWYNHPLVFIRSLASRGSLGGLNPKIIEITDVMKTAPFDFIIIETVGVGQSEVEIAGLADLTVVVIVPEAGDEIQTMKAGLMEIADIFVVNKADRPGTDSIIKSLRSMLAPAFQRKKEEIPIIKTIAAEKQGTEELLNAIIKVHSSASSDLKLELLTKKAYQLIQENRMKDVNHTSIRKQIQQVLTEQASFNLYKFVTEKQYE